jgi:hypothetical protein
MNRRFRLVEILPVCWRPIFWRGFGGSFLREQREERERDFREKSGTTELTEQTH